NSSVKLITIWNMPGSARPNREVPLAVGDTVVVNYNETVTLNFVGIDITSDESGNFEQTTISIESGPTMGELGALSDPDVNLPITTFTANYTATENVSTPDLIEFIVSTPNDGNSLAGQIHIFINPVALAPVLTDVDDVEMNEDETETVPINYGDEDTDLDIAYWTVSSSPVVDGLLTIENLTETTADLQITPPADYWNTTGITVTITLTDESGLSDVIQFNLSINNVNDAPSMVAIENQTTLEDNSTSLALNATDIDNETGDLSFYASTGNTDIVTVSVTDNVLTLTPVENATGTGEIEVWASDGAV
ncbi:uncharacterized protein METZ01_LOCUS366905, partial [marine metagenome]